MEPKGKYLIVGIGTTLIIVALFLTVLWLNQGKGGDGHDRFMVLFRGVSLSGIQNDGLVTMRGIQVGRIKGIRISPHDIEQIEVEIALRPETPVRESTRAVIQTNILTGLSSIDLIGGNQNSPPLKRNMKAYAYPVIMQGQSDLQAFTSSMPELLKSVSEITQKVIPLLEDARGVLSKENRENISKTLANIEKISSKLADEGNSVGQITDKLVASLEKTLSDNLDETSKQLTSLLAELQISTELITKDMSQMREQIVSSGKEIVPGDRLLFGAPSDAYGPGER